MPEALDTYGKVFERGSTVMLARVTFVDGQEVTRADLASAQYTIYELDPCGDGGQPVVGHEDVNLIVNDVIYDTLQTGAPWSIDAEGYNFRHEVDVSTADAFPISGRDYQVRYKLQPVIGQCVVFRFQLRAI